MLSVIKDLIRTKLQSKPQLNHTLIETTKMKKTTAKKVMSEAKGKPMMKGKNMESKKTMPKKGMKKGY
jgi:hypothetical protein